MTTTATKSLIDEKLGQAAGVLQELGMELLALPRHKAEELELPEELMEALDEARRIGPKNRSAYQRQRQRIGALMREVDADKIDAQLRKLKRQR